MENGTSYLLRKIALASLSSQKPKETDYEKNGLRYCGICGKPRQGFKVFPVPTEENPENTITLKIGFSCDCDKAEEARQDAERQAKRDMEEIEKLRSVSLMDERMKEARFSSFKATKYNAKNLMLCQHYVDRFDQMLQENKGLIFWGDCGTGKSFAAACIANALLEKKCPVIMTSFVKIIGAMDADRSIGEQLISELNHAKLLILDDFGTERCTNAAIEKVYNVVDSRYRKKLPMIITTNLTEDQMKNEMDIRYSRIYDRLFECCYLMQFVGPSWRKKAAARTWDEMRKLLED